MARATEIYSSKEPRLFLINETTAMTANVTSMLEVPITGLPSITENAYRDDEVKHGAGRTAKEADGVVITKGNVKEIGFQFRMVDSLYMKLLENGAGKVVEAGGDLQIAYNHTPADVGNGDSFTDWTGTITCAYVPPFASEAQVFVGCVVSTLGWSASKGSEGGLVLVDCTLQTQEEILTDQASPSGTVAYTLSNKTIYDLCDTFQVNSIDAQGHGFELTHTFNPKFGGYVCDGGASSIGKCIPEVAVSGSVTILVDSNFPDAHKLPRSNTTVPISLSDGSDFFVTIAKAQINADVQPSDNDDYLIWTLPFKAKAGTSGNLIEEQVG